MNLALLPWTAAEAAPAPEAASVCLGCHGTGALAGAPPSYHIPRLGGQPADYIVSALRAYRSGQRTNPIMRAQAQALSERDITEVAAYFAGPKKGLPPAHKDQMPKKVVQVCGACHGETGLGALPELPVLSGQHSDFLVQALRDYRTGARTNPVMPLYAKALTEAEIRTLAAYFSSKGALRDTP